MSGRDAAALRAVPDRRGAVQHGAGRASATLLPFPQRPQSAFPELAAVRNRLAPALLAQAEERAAALNVGADRVLVAVQSITEDAYLRSYASATGIPFELLDGVPRSACPIDDDRMLDAVAEGLLPLRVQGELVLVVAPRGTAARQMLHLTRNRPDLRRRLRVTSVERLHRFVIRHCGAALGLRAAETLRVKAPLLSAAPANGKTTKRWWAVLTALFVAAFVAFPDQTITTVSIAGSLLFLGWMLLRLLGVMMARPAPPRPVPIAEADLPVYTVIAALYREAASVAELVDAIRQLDWPREKLDVKLVIEAGDEETRAALARLDLEPCFEIVVAPPADPRTKPKALNAALPFARGTFTVIYDAEDRPEPNQLRAALDAFLRHGPELACVQAALTIDNTADSWLARMFTAEYASHFDVLLPSLARLGLPLPLGGSSNHFRTQVLRAIGAWDPHNVTEDADLGMRLARFGYRSTVVASTTYEEAPASWRPWLKQRTRWFKGWLQTWLVHMRKPAALWRDLGAAGFVVFQLIVGGNVLAALIYPAFAALVTYRLIAGETVFDAGVGGLHVVALFGGWAAGALSQLAGLARRNLLPSAWVIATAPLHWMLLSAAAWRGVLQFMRDPYRWEKTEHGLARSSRLAPRQGARPHPAGRTYYSRRHEPPSIKGTPECPIFHRTT